MSELINVGKFRFKCTNEVLRIIRSAHRELRQGAVIPVAYVYAHKVNGRIFYIGKSLGDRRGYSLVGRTNAWFKFYDNNDYIELVLLAIGLTMQQADYIEHTLIKQFSEHLVNSMVGHHNTALSRSVCQYDTSGKLIKQFENAAVAGAILNISKSEIAAVCKYYETLKRKGKQKKLSAGGYVWKYN